MTSSKLKLTLFLTLAFLSWNSASANPNANPHANPHATPSANPDEIQLVNLQTREVLIVKIGRLPAPSVLNRFLRCSNDRKYTLMDPRLVAVAIEAAVAHKISRVEILSAFRTSRLNEAMAAEGKNVALRSRHINGQALDLRLPGLETPALCEYFQGLKLGGVGCYLKHKFVHIDVGPVRTWGNR